MNLYPYRLEALNALNALRLAAKQKGDEETELCSKQMMEPLLEAVEGKICACCGAIAEEWERTGAGDALCYKCADAVGITDRREQEFVSEEA